MSTWHSCLTIWVWDTLLVVWTNEWRIQTWFLRLWSWEQVLKLIDNSTEQSILILRERDSARVAGVIAWSGDRITLIVTAPHISNIHQTHVITESVAWSTGALTGQHDILSWSVVRGWVISDYLTHVSTGDHSIIGQQDTLCSTLPGVLWTLTIALVWDMNTGSSTGVVALILRSHTHLAIITQIASIRTYSITGNWLLLTCAFKYSMFHKCIQLTNFLYEIQNLIFSLPLHSKNVLIISPDRQMSPQGTELTGQVPLQGISTDWHWPLHSRNKSTSNCSRHLEPHWTQSQLLVRYTPWTTTFSDWVGKV